MGEKIQTCFQRYEKKYMLNPTQYQSMLEGMQRYVRPDRYWQYSLCNIYYDTDDYRLIRASIEKPIYKEKLRMRSYGVPKDTDNVFVEIKKKFNGVVYKRRVTMSAYNAIKYINERTAPPNDNQICHEIDWFMQSYRPKPKVFIAYEREAYAGNDTPDLRITFDSNLRWRDTGLDLRLGDWGKPLLTDEQTLMEIKIPGAAPVWLARLLSEVGAFPCSFSKYGTCYKTQLCGKVFCRTD